MVLIKMISRLHAVPLDKSAGRHTTTVRKLERLHEELLGSTRNAQAIWEHSSDRSRRGSERCCSMDARAPDLNLGAPPSCGRPGPGHKTAHEVMQGHRR